MNWITITTVALTATCTILSTLGVVSPDEGADLTKTGAAAVAALGAFVTSLITVIANHRKKGE